MRKYFLFTFISLIFANESQAQAKGTKIGYIDMEYILQNVPNYTESQNQLEQKTQKWKQEIEVKKLEINKLKEALKSEKALLTKSLIEERESEIKFLEEEALDYQQKRFGPNGDLVVQKSVLTKPIQDQVFTAIQDIAESKKYDFIFDKTSDLTILFAAKRFDISDQVLRVLNRAEKREQLTKKQLKEEEEKEEKEDAINQNPALASRQKALDERKIARDQAIADKKLLQEEKKKEAEAKRNQILTDRTAKKSGAPETSKTAENTNDSEKEAAKIAAAEAKQAQTEERAKILEERKKGIEDRKKEAEEKRKQILEEREAKKNATTATNTKTTETGINLEKEAAKTAAAEAKQKQTEERAKVLEERKKAIEDRKKEAEEKRKQILEERELKKIVPISTVIKSTETDTNSDIDATKKAAIEAKQKQTEERAKVLEDRKKAIEENKRVAEEKRKQILEEKEAKKIGTISEVQKKEEVTKPVISAEPASETSKNSPAEAKQKQIEDKAKTIEDRKKVIEERKKALEEKRKKVLEERDAAKKLKEETLKTTKDNSNNN